MFLFSVMFNYLKSQALTESFVGIDAGVFNGSIMALLGVFPCILCGLHQGSIYRTAHSLQGRPIAPNRTEKKKIVFPS